ncbi:hypothetical protein MMPV_004714 [Pyropia vietnamensis]
MAAAALLAAPLLVTAVAPSDGATWTYTGPSGPDFWATIDDSFAVCGSGERQSPINVMVTPPVWRKSIAGLARPPVSGVLAPKPAARTVPLECNSTTSCGLLKWDGTVHTLANVHGHTPAEYQLNGVSLPLELHMVHASANPMSKVVVGLLFKFGPANPLLAKLITAQASGAPVTVTRNEWRGILRRGSGYCQLQGSLTTPPCMEGLSWFLQNEVLTASREQVRAFQSRWAPSGNARPLQPGNNRQVTCYSPKGHVRRNEG